MGGEIISWPDQPKLDQVMKKPEDFFPFNQSTRESKDNIDAFRNFLALAKKKNIRIIFFNAPVHPLVFKKRQTDGFNKKYLEILGNLEEEFENFEVIKPYFSVFKEKYFVDFSHLNTEGFSIFSEILRDNLN